MMKRYCSMFQNFDTFNTPHDALFLVFGVPNAKYLAFGTPDSDALRNFIFLQLFSASFSLFSVRLPKNY